MTAGREPEKFPCMGEEWRLAEMELVKTEA